MDAPALKIRSLPPTSACPFVCKPDKQRKAPKMKRLPIAVNRATVPISSNFNRFLLHNFRPAPDYFVNAIVNLWRRRTVVYTRAVRESTTKITTQLVYTRKKCVFRCYHANQNWRARRIRPQACQPLRYVRRRYFSASG